MADARTIVAGLSDPDYQAERLLPSGKTCADCRHGARCDGLFGAIRKGFTSCDFWPSRFAVRAILMEDQHDNA